jgi:hypothetical protein
MWALCAALAVERGRGQRHADRVEHQLRGRRAHLEIDHLGAGQREGLEIGLELDGVVGRDDHLRQPAGRALERIDRLGGCGAHRHEHDGKHRRDLAGDLASELGGEERDE